MARSKAREFADLASELLGSDNVVPLTRTNYTSSNTDPQVITSINSPTSNTFVFHVKSYTTTQSHLTSLNVIVEGGGAYLTEYGDVRTSGSLSSYDINIDSVNDKIELQATPTNAVTDYTVVRINL